MPTQDTCQFAQTCSGCSLWVSEDEELKQKKQEFIELHKNLGEFTFDIHTHSVGSFNFRTRLDLSLGEDGWGLWNKTGTSIVKIICPLATSELQKFLSEFQLIKWPIKKASARLRVSPSMKRGLWLDMSNEDVKLLFHSKIELQQLLTIADFVEIGQKRKSLYWNKIESRFQLVEKEFESWIDIPANNSNNAPTPLYSNIGGFTQTGPKANQCIDEILQKILAPLKKNTPLFAIEFGAGIGTLTLPASRLVEHITALEIDERACLALESTLKLQQINNYKIFHGDFARKNLTLSLPKNINLFIVNPARSGVGDLFAKISDQVKYVLYMTCFPESYIKDTKKLAEFNFRPKEAHLINQFPHTSHSEWITLWQR